MIPKISCLRNDIVGIPHKINQMLDSPERGHYRSFVVE